MTYYDPNNFYYDQPRSTMTHHDWNNFYYDIHYDQNNFYYDPLWPTVTQTISIMIHYDPLWPKQFLLWSTITIMFREKSQIKQ